MIDMSDFSTQLIAAVVAGLVLLLVQRTWMGNAKGAAAVPSAGPQNDSGNQAWISDSQITGGVRVDQSYRDESQHTTIIHQNMERSPDASAADDDYGKVVLLLIAMAVAAIMFVLLRPLLEAVSYGAVVSTVVMALAAALRARQLKTWSSRALATVITVVGTGLVTVLTWRAMGDVVRDGMSLGAIREAVPSFSADSDESVVASYFDYLVNSAFSSFFGFHEHVLPFTIALLLAGVAQAALIVVALSAVWDWNAYLSFRSGSQKKHIVARAKSHEGGVLGPLVAAALLAALALLSAHGILYDMFLSLISG